MSENKPNIPSTWIDPDDAPESDAQFFQEADLYQGNQLIRRGKGLPKLSSRKVLLSVLYSPEGFTYFRQTGEG
ncbi:hypothetical protein RIE95_07105 [Acidithiobacillus thiooxidans]|uniref:hypothetical protein n=1 Tax=Acidithiobacillus thiooxidans TaxID=930 RepID=UPI0028642776|nr:hypothetical protein [Acidithiobacillus thiooxidans]MDR7926754.1 hypothetical protein [Acidithiobacillus thiooxidans]